MIIGSTAHPVTVKYHRGVELVVHSGQLGLPFFPEVNLSTVLSGWGSLRLTRSPAVTRVGPTILVVTDVEGHPRSLVFVSSERAYATSYWSPIAM